MVVVFSQCYFLSSKSCKAKLHFVFLIPFIPSGGVNMISLILHANHSPGPQKH